MKLVMVERNSVGLDVNVDGYKEFGDVTYYPHTTLEEGAKHIDAQDAQRELAAHSRHDGAVASGTAQRTQRAASHHSKRKPDAGIHDTPPMP